MRVLNLTGTGLKFASGIIALSGGILPVALILTMGSSLILGMGLPTAAAYLICAAVIVPALTGLGVPALTGHLFIFYFACLSAITPPVALAAFTAASLGKTKPMGVALTAVRLGIVAFIVPYMFVYQPALLGIGETPEIIWAAITAIIGVIGIAGGMQGWLLCSTSACPLKLVISQCGFNSYGIFFKVFKESTGKTPKEFLNESKNKG